MINVNDRIETMDKIGYLLLKKGIIDIQILEKALEAKEKDLADKKRNLGQILVEEFNFDHDIIFKEISILYAFKEIIYNPAEFTEERVSGIKHLIEKAGEDVKNLLVNHNVLPYGFDIRIKDKLILATINPTDKALTKIAYALNAKKYELNFIKKRDFDKLLEIIIPQQNEFLKAVADSDEIMDVDNNNAADTEEALDSEINKSALVNLIEGALVEGVRRGISDLHIFPVSASRTEIHFREDGKLALWYAQEKTMPEAVIAIVKDRAKGLDRFEKEQAQDGFIQREIDGYIIRFRVSVLPMVGTELKNRFESVVIRILDDRNVIRDLSKLGLVGYANDAFEKAINQPQGMVILTGPTGSGKSTTLIAALYQVISPQVNVLTVEDPVEYVIEGARQLKIGHKMDFEQAIRAILRHDPDIVLVGEMRDKETAETAVKLANTGHLTFSTLHTNDAPSAVARLYKMGVEPFLIAYAINIIVAQRLIRKLCNNCKRRVTELDEGEMKAAELDIEEWKNYEIYEAVGCEKCNKSGYKGRMAVHEALYFTKEIREIIVRSGIEVDEDKIRTQARKDGTLNLRENGLEKVKDGNTSIQEVISSTMDE